MKKSYRLVFSLVLMLALMFSFSATAFAAERTWANGLKWNSSKWSASEADRTLSTNSGGNLKLTNSSGGERVLSFHYVIEASGQNYIQIRGNTSSEVLVNYNKQTGTFEEDFSTTLVNDESIQFYLSTGVKVTVTDVDLYSPVELVFEPAENGSYTVNGEAVAEETSISGRTDTEFTLAAAAAEGYRFMGWQDLTRDSILSTEANAVLTFTEDTRVTALFQKEAGSDAPFSVNGIFFDTYEDAKAYARTGDVIVLEKDYTLTENAEVPAGVTLLVPFDENNTCYRDDIVNRDDPRVNQVYATPYAYRTLTIGSNVTLTVNGELSISGQHTASTGSGRFYGPTGPNGFVQMESGSLIRVNGSMYAYGYVLGSGAVYVNGSVYELMQISDFRGGSATAAIAMDMTSKVFPFCQYYIQNVEVPMSVSAGAREYVMSSLYVTLNSTMVKASAVAEFIGPNGMFNMGDGNVTKQYVPSTDRLLISVNGNGGINGLALSLFGYDVDSQNYVLPITSNITINVNSGNAVTLNQDTCFLPGSEVNVAENAEISVSEGYSVYVYDSSEWGPYANGQTIVPLAYSPTRTSVNSDTKSARMDVNGTVKASGQLFTTASGAEIISSGGTGKVVLLADAPESGITHQYGKSVDAPVDISVVPALLKNNTEPAYTETAGALQDDYFTWNTEEGRWVRSVRVTYDANGGTGEMAEQIHDYNEAFELPENAFTREGYTFAGWNEVKEPSEETPGTSYADKESVQFAQDVTLYAQWERDTEGYTISFMPNGGTGEMEPVFTEFGDDVPLFPECGFTAPEGKEFAAWGFREDSTLDDDVFAPGDEFMGNEDGEEEVDTVFYAIWVDKTDAFTVKWVSDDGTELEKDEDVEPGATPSYDGATPEKEPDEQYSYVFAGWKSSEDDQVYTENFPAVTGNVTYTATYTETLRSYTVTWKNEDGAVLETDENVPYGTMPSYDGATPEKAPTAQSTFTFKSWSPNVEEVSGDAVYTAIYNSQAREYTITWILDPDDPTKTETTSVAYGEIPSHAAPTKEATAQYSYEFTRWNPSPKAVTGDTTYTARYNSILRMYSVKYVLNGGTLQGGTTYEEIEVPYGNRHTLQNAAKNHYTLQWQSSADNQLYNAGATVTIESNVTFEAVWTPEVYTVSFNVNAPAGAQVDPEHASMEPITATYGTPIDKPACGFVVTGYQFTGWKDRAGNTYNSDKLDITENVTLYAQWKAVKCTVSYDVNGGAPLDYPSFGADYNAEIQLATTTRKGYTLIGWTDQNGVSHAVGPYTVQGDVQFTAEWAPVEYTVTVNDGVAATPATVTLTVLDNVYEALEGYVPNRPGFEFMGWEHDGTMIGDAELFSGDYTQIDAVWEKEVYTISFNLDGGSFTDTNQSQELTAYYGDVITLPGVTKNGHTFQGWKQQSNDAVITADTFTVVGSEGFTAQWKANTYTVTWVVDGTTTTETYTFGDKPVYKVNDEPAVPEKPQTETYTFQFAGWEPVITEDTRVTDNVTYTANFEPVLRTFTVNFDANGGTGSMASLTVNGVQGTPLPDNSFTREHWHFVNWNEAEDGSGQSYEKNASITAVQDVTLYAQWEKDTYTVTWLMDDASEIGSSTVAYGDKPAHAAVEKPEDEQFSYSFAGWRCSADNTVYTDELPEVVGDVSFTAVFTETVRQYQVTWIVNGESTEELYDYGVKPVYKINGEAATPTIDETPEFHYVFTGWDPIISDDTTVTGTVTFTAQFDAVTNTYTVTWVNEDGAVLETDENVPYGSTPSFDGTTPQKEMDAQFIYTFDKWSPDLAAVSANVTYQATYKTETRKYTITWLDEDGSQLKQEQVEFGTMPSYGSEMPTKEQDAQYKYSFQKWTPDLVPVAGEATYQAVYSTELRSYTVTWANADGSVLETDENVPYGTMPSYDGATPEKGADAQYTYSFAGWNTEPSAVTGNATYTATYTETLRSYTVLWVNEDGTLLETDENVPYGTTPSYDGATPEKSADEQYTYTFDKWSPAVSTVTGNVTYTATFTEETNLYTVTWANADGTVLETDENVPYGATPSYDGATPEKAGNAQYTYSFAGWNTVPSAVTGNVTYTATYTETLRSYTVTWIGADGAVLETDENVPYGTTPSYDGATPEKAADLQYRYSFEKWSPAVSTVTGNATYTAAFTAEPILYEITWKDVDGAVLNTTYVAYGQTPSFGEQAPQKESTVDTVYSFDHWEPEVVAVSGDAEYTAIFASSVRYYDVTWDVDNVKTVESYPFGSKPVYKLDGNPAVPAKEGNARHHYVFTGWDPEVTDETTVTADITYIAQFEEVLNTYTVTWVNEDGTVLETDENVPYGATPDYGGETPEKEGSAQYSYTFRTWDPAIEPVGGDTTYKATYTESVNKYTVTWYNTDGTLLDKESEVPYGSKPVFKDAEGNPAVPTMSGELGVYEFSGWDPEIKDDTIVESDIAFTAQYSYTGWRISEEGKQYLINSVVQMSPDLFEVDGKQYFLDPNNEGYAAVGVTPINAEDPGHVFDADGVWLKNQQGVYTDEVSADNDIYLVENGIIIKDYGLYRTSEEVYYYFGEDGKALKDCWPWIERTNGLLPVFAYDIGEDGILIHDDVTLDGVLGDQENGWYYYIDGIKVHYGMFERDGYYYYADRTGRLVTSKTYWCTNMNGLFGGQEGPFTFDELGRVVFAEVRNGLYWEENSWFFYQDGKRAYVGLFEVKADDEVPVVRHNADQSTENLQPGFYYGRYTGEMVYSKNYWISKTNDLLPEKAYTFGDDGRIIFPDKEKNGFYYEDDSWYYYVEGVRNYAGVIIIDGNYYYVRNTGEMVYGKNYWVSKTNGLLEEKSYTFADDGHMILPDFEKNGFVEEDGVMYYYVKGERNYAGVIVIDGKYYYVKSSGEVVRNKRYWISKTNGLLEENFYNFAEDGQIIF